MIIRNIERPQKRFNLKGAIRIFEQGNPSNVYFEDHNVICQTVKSLFARLMANTVASGDSMRAPRPTGHEVQYGVWGLALGSGDPTWAQDTQPDGTPMQTALITPVLRKALSTVNFVDTSLTPTPAFTNKVDFQTIVNATTDKLVNIGIREMGLIGGGSKQANGGAGTDMIHAPYWDPAVGDPDSVTLINYKTLPPLLLPPGVNLVFSWVLTF